MNGKGSARSYVSSAFVLVGALAASCAHEERRAPHSARPPDERAARLPEIAPPQYLVADPASNGVVAVRLANGALGLVVDKARVLTGYGEPRVASEEPDRALRGAARIPTRFGGGFLFWTDAELYRADAFDGALRAIVRLPDPIADLSFSPKSLLVHTHDGERWAIALPSGERAKIDPLGVVDAEGLDDGRALAFNDQGAAFASTDGGAHWTDVTANVKSSPTRVGVVDGDVWLFESGGGAHRLESDGRLSFFDKAPAAEPVELRPRDPRWHGADPVLRTAFRVGAAVDETTAIVADGGDIVRVDVRTGELLSVDAGRLPPDASCEAVPTASDVLFACVTRAQGVPGVFGGSGGAGTAFVVAHTLSGETVVEQSFAERGAFYASDDGGLAFAGPCTGASAPGRDHGACVRQPGGTWQDVDLSALATDAGQGDVNVARWVPRADGRAVALVLDPTPGIYDPRAGVIAPVAVEARDALAQGLSFVHGVHRGKALGHAAGVVDWSWSFVASGALRGWQRQGGSIDVGEDGAVTRSPWSFELVASGPRALGKSKDGRLYQSTDHGGTWVEVASPPTGGASVELRACSSAGCDLGGFYRVGWAARPPRGDAARTKVRPPPEIRRSAAAELSCRASGPPRIKILPRTDRSPEDLGLGALRLATAPPEKEDVSYVRTPLARELPNPVHELASADADNPSLRALVSGYATEGNGDAIEVLGPDKNPRALRRTLAFVPAFDPTSTVKRGVIAMSEVIAAGRAIGMSSDEVLGEDMTDQGAVALVTPADPSAPSDLAFHTPRGVLAYVRSTERVRVVIRPPQNEGIVVSGAALPGDEAVFLEVESSGVGHVFKVAQGGISDLFDVSPTLTDTEFYPANPDAVAVGPKNEIGVLRTASGSDPASALDPALLLVPAMPPVALAPWSTLTLASDPECKRDPGWRATLQVIAPWVKISAPELHPQDGLMLARVKWSAARVCLEGLEVRLPSVDLRIREPSGAPDAQALHTWLVAKNGVFARVGIGEGTEWRQPLECALVR